MLRKALIRRAIPLISLRNSVHTQAKISSALPNSETGLFNVQWTDGTKGAYPFVWLRDNAPAPPTYYIGERSSARELGMTDLNLNVKPTSFSLKADGLSLDITWSDDLTVNYKSLWLQKRNLTDSNLGLKRETNFHAEDTVKWEVKEMKAELENPAEFDRLMTDDEYMSDQLIRFLKFGLLRATGVPKETGQVEKFGKRLGFIITHPYDTIFTVRSIDRNPSNAAFTRKPLEMHTDYSFIMNPPDVQMLHCITQAESGGFSQFADGFRVGEQLKEEKPDVYDILTETIIEYVDEAKPKDMTRWCVNVGRWPVLRLVNGRVERVIFSNYLRSWFLNCPVEEYERVYHALHTFITYCYQPRNLLETKMKAGDFMMFANNRVLHGRSSYEVGANVSDERHLEGCYLSFDAVKSFIRHSKLSSDPDFPVAYQAGK